MLWFWQHPDSDVASALACFVRSAAVLGVMPDGLTGHELAERVRAERPGLKLLYSGVYSHDVLGKDVISREGINFLQKPYPPRKLLQTVRDCLEGRNPRKDV